MISIANTDQTLIQRLEALIKKAHSVRPGFNSYYANPSDYAELQSQGLALLTSTLSPEHSYTKSFKEHTCTPELEKKMEYIQAAAGILKAFLEDVKNGYLISYRELINAGIFSDFADTAEYLLDENYKDAAAVIIGSVLEEHLRKLCVKANISLEENSPDGTGRPKKADVLNAELRKAEVYLLTQQKSITGWLHIRNLAAHGKYGEYQHDEVKLMLQGIRQFISTFPA